MDRAVKRTDPLGFVALVLPVAAMVVHAGGGLLAGVGFHGLGALLMMAGAAVLFVSIPFAGILAIRSRRSHRQRCRRAIVGMAVGCVVAAWFVVATRVVHAKAEATLRELEQRGKNLEDEP